MLREPCGPRRRIGAADASNAAVARKAVVTFGNLDHVVFELCRVSSPKSGLSGRCALFACDAAATLMLKMCRFHCAIYLDATYIADEL